MDTKDFKEVVAEYIEYDSVSGAYNKEKALDLAGHFACMKSWPKWWASGVVNPLPRMRQIIIKYIQKQKTGV